jgi:hypothetical protein
VRNTASKRFCNAAASNESGSLARTSTIAGRWQDHILFKVINSSG